MLLQRKATKLLHYDLRAFIHERAFSSEAMNEQFVLHAVKTRSAAKNSVGWFFFKVLSSKLFTVLLIPANLVTEM